MHKFPCLKILENFMERVGDLFAYGLGSNGIAKIEQHDFTALCKLEGFKGDLNPQNHVSLMSYTEPLRLECEFLEVGVNFSLRKFMQDHMFIRELTHEIAKTT